MNQPTPPALRILLAGLPESDVARLQTFVRVRSDRLRHEWQVVSTAPVDVYVHGADEVPTIPGQLDRVPHQIGIADAGSHAAAANGLLLRPLQYEAFIDQLVAVEQRKAGTSSATPAPTAGARDAPVASGPVAGRRFRLKRWPGASLLQSHRHATRMASCLASRTLGAAELSTLSGASQADCEQFLDTLMQAGLLREAAADTPAAPSASTPARDRAPAENRAPQPSRTLLANLRAKLGIRSI